jgi:hypothetical protein
MSARRDLEQAAEAARRQVQDARDALARTRATAGGGPAASAQQAEVQVEAIRRTIERDVRTLRERAVALDVNAPGPARTAVLTAGAGLAAAIGIGALGAAGLRRARARRDIDRQARALAGALARQASGVVEGRGRTGLLLAVTGVALAAGAGVLAQRRHRPIDPDDLWLPERPTRES